MTILKWLKNDRKERKMIKFVKINKENWRLPLCVGTEQVENVADKTTLLARAYAFRNERSKAFYIYAREMPVGMGLIYDCKERESYVLSQVFIDERYQRQGYGKEAIRKILEEMRKEAKFSKVILTYIEGNEVARKLYKSFGFVKIEQEEDEIVMELRL